MQSPTIYADLNRFYAHKYANKIKNLCRLIKIYADYFKFMQNKKAKIDLVCNSLRRFVTFGLSIYA